MNYCWSISHKHVRKKCHMVHHFQCLCVQIVASWCVAKNHWCEHFSRWCTRKRSASRCRTPCAQALIDNIAICNPSVSHHMTHLSSSKTSLKVLLSIFLSLQCQPSHSHPRKIVITHVVLTRSHVLGIPSPPLLTYSWSQI